MGKAAEPLSRIPAIAEVPPPGDRISVMQAGELLLRRFPNPHTACAKLDDAIRHAQVRLYAGEHLTDPVDPGIFTTHLRVAVTKDGRLEVRATRALNGTFIWTVGREGILKLIEGDVSATAGRNPRGAGRKRKYVSETDLLNMAWAYVYKNGAPPSLEALCDALRDEHKNKVPKVSRCAELLGPNWPAIKRAHASGN
jgi:hypothetical protein